MKVIFLQKLQMIAMKTKQTSFMQGIFVEYGITVDDSVETIRNGGFGSTTISNS